MTPQAPHSLRHHALEELRYLKVGCRTPCASMRGITQPPRGVLAGIHPADLTTENERGKLGPLEGRCWPRDPFHQGLDPPGPLGCIAATLEEDVCDIL